MSRLVDDAWLAADDALQGLTRAAWAEAFLKDLPDNFSELVGTINIQLTEEMMQGCPESIKKHFRALPEVVPSEGD